MLRRCGRRLDLHTLTADSPSFRAHPMRQLLSNVLHSPYKESFKEFWSTPVPWEAREYGAKPKPGDPVPMRKAATSIVMARNKHINPAAVEAGEDNDYKVLMMFREPRGRYQKDQFVFPAAPLHLADTDDDWAKLLRRLGVKTEHEDLHLRIAAIRGLLVEANMLVLPEEGGGLAEVQGPPGPRKWHLMIMSFPHMMRQFLDILEIPMEGCFNRLLPFRRIQTPTNELFRFDTHSYIVPFEKIPCVKYTISTNSEQLVWVSPREALARHDAGVMEMPTPNLILMNELDKEFPTFDELHKKRTRLSEPEVIIPEMVHDPQTNMATVLLPGDLHHSGTEAMLAEKRKARKQRAAQATAPEQAVRLEVKDTDSVEVKEEAARAYREAADDMDLDPWLSRFEFVKDEPWGVRAVFTSRPIEAGEAVPPLPGVAALSIEEAESLKEERMREPVPAERPRLTKEDLSAFTASIGNANGSEGGSL